MKEDPPDRIYFKKTSKRPMIYRSTASDILRTKKTMPVEIKYDKNRKVLNISISGISDFCEYTTTLEKIINSSDYPADVRTIWDLRKADFSSADVEIMSQLVEIRKRFKQRNNCRVALIASDDLQFGFSRMFQTLLTDELPHELMVFRDYEEGEQWLLEDHKN